MLNCLVARVTFEEMDVHSPAQRRYNMSSIRSSGTAPELALRRLLHADGFRYRLNVKSLPGTPDLVFPARHKAIFVNGCFWHSHSCKYGAVTPKTNQDFWTKKRAATIDRDLQNIIALESMGWDVLTVWECELRDPHKVLEQARGFLAR